MTLGDVHALIEQDDAAIPKRFQRGDVATSQTAGNPNTRDRAGQLHFGMRTRTQARVGFDERRVAADVEDRDRLAGAKERLRLPTSAAAGAAALAASLDERDV